VWARGPPRQFTAELARARAARGTRAAVEVGRRALWQDGLAAGVGDSRQHGGALLAGDPAGPMEYHARLGELRGILEEIGGRLAVARVVAHCRIAGQLNSGQQLGRRELVAGAKLGDPREEALRLRKAAECQ